jgi:MSHA pilin protein MshD
MYSELRGQRQRGLTLIELLMFIVIVAIALAGILQVLRLTTANSADPVRRKQALMIAEGLLEEVQMAGFTFCDPTDPNADNPEVVTSSVNCTVPEAFGQTAPEPVGARPFDNVNDYVAAPDVAAHAFDSSGVNPGLLYANGVQMPVQGYRASVTITPDTLGPSNTPVGNGDVLRIRIEVSYDGQRLVLDGYRTRYAPHQL